MKRLRNRQKRKPVPVPIASMGDIAFLLIIFFLVLSEPAKNLNLSLPTSSQVDVPEYPTAARVAIDKEGVLYFNDKPRQSKEEIESAVRLALANADNDQQRRIEFKCDINIRKEKFEPVLKAIAEGGGIIEAIAEPMKDQP